MWTAPGCWYFQTAASAFATNPYVLPTNLLIYYATQSKEKIWTVFVAHAAPQNASQQGVAPSEEVTGKD